MALHYAQHNATGTVIICDSKRDKTRLLTFARYYTDLTSVQAKALLKTATHAWAYIDVMDSGAANVDVIEPEDVDGKRRYTVWGQTITV